MDVGVWLRGLGLDRYEAAFRDNSIDEDILPDLSEGDLAQIGVTLGDRKRLLRAIASLGTARRLLSQRAPHPRPRQRMPPNAASSRSCFATS